MTRSAVIAVIADTHVSRAGQRTIPAPALTHLRAADLIVHAGDVTEAWVLDELAELAPVVAVLGNNDHGLDLPERVELDVAGVALAVVHDSGPTAGRAARLRRWFPSADLVVFGHSHLPLDEEGVAGQRLLNPGSATWRRTAPTHTMAVVELAHGCIVEIRHLDLEVGGA